MVESFISDRVLTVLAASDRERLESRQRAAAASKPLLDGIFASFGKWGPRSATPDGIHPGSTLHDIVPDQHSSDSADSLHLGYTQREVLTQHPARQGRSGRQALPGAPISARILHDEFGTFRLVGMDASGLDIDDDADVLTSADEAEDAFYEGLLMQSHNPSAASLPAPLAAVTSAHITSITAAVASRDAAAAAAAAVAGRSSPPRSMLSSLSSPPRGLSLAPMLSLWQQLSTAVQQRGTPSSAAAVTAHTLSPAAPAPPGSSTRLPARYQQHAGYQYQLSSNSSASSASASNSASSLGSVDAPSTSTSIPSVSLSQFHQHRQQEQPQLLQPPGPLSASVAHYLRSRPRLRDMLDASRASAASANDIMTHRPNPRAPAQLG